MSVEENVGLDLQRRKGWAFQAVVQVTEKRSNGLGPSASKPKGVRFELGLSDLRAHILSNLLIIIRIPQSLNF